MNINYQETKEKVGSESLTISEVLSKLKENEEKSTKKEGVSLLDITKKLSSKKFDKKKAK